MDNRSPSEPREHELLERVAGLESALAQSEIRLQDTDHRARNDFQLVWSIFQMQVRRMPDGPAREAIRRANDRICAVAAVQKHLPQPGDPPGVEAGGLLRDLAGELASAAGRADIRLEIAVDEVRVPARQAAPLALVLEELTLNALRHAYPRGGGGAVRVRFRRLEEEAQLQVSDDGVGADPEGLTRGFGLTLVELLCKQLKADLSLDGGAGAGLTAVVRIPEAP